MLQNALSFFLSWLKLKRYCSGIVFIPVDFLFIYGTEAFGIQWFHMSVRHSCIGASGMSHPDHARRCFLKRETSCFLTAGTVGHDEMRAGIAETVVIDGVAIVIISFRGNIGWFGLFITRMKIGCIRQVDPVSLGIISAASLISERSLKFLKAGWTG